jgi:hypothetical protein
MIVRHKPGTLVGSEVVAVVKGRGSAENAVDRYDRKLSPEERITGWSHFLESSGLPAGTDPHTATDRVRAAKRKIGA